MTTRTSPRGRAPSEARTAEMLWAAAQLFASRGVAATTTREVAAAAHTTERTLFKHFGSKDGLVQAVLEEAVLAHLTPASLAALSAAIDGFGGDLAAWHRALLVGRLKAWAGAPELTRLLLMELLRDAGVRDRFATQWTPAVWTPLVQLFAKLQAEGCLRRDIAAEQLARQFLSLNLGFLVARLVLAPGHGWDDAGEAAAIAMAFQAASRPGG